MNHNPQKLRVNRRQALGVPLTRVIQSQSRSPPGTRTRRPASVTAIGGTPSKLVMRVRFPSPALNEPQVRGYFLRLAQLGSAGRAGACPTGLNLCRCVLLGL